jgi:CAAX prenyl protease-like protein
MISSRPWLPYVAPFAIFLILTALEGRLPQQGENPHPTWYPIGYAIKIAIVAVLAWYFRSTWRDMTPWPSWSGLALAVGIGLSSLILWVGLDGRYPLIPGMGKRQGFDPSVLTLESRIAFLVVRMFGLVLLVPLIEELFWRSFLMRWIIDQDFSKVAIGTVTPLAAAVTSILFALEHPEWLPALLTGLAWAWLLWYTKSVAACFVSHVTANLALGIYVLATGAWKYL